MQMLSKTQIVCPRLVGDDSDFHDALHEKEVDDVKEAEEGNSDENDVNGISEKEEDEGSDENEEARDSKFGVTYDPWEAFHAAFEAFPRDTYYQFSKRSSSSVKIRDIKMTKMKP
ncbi:hypothetical protein PInf_010012 [Phytophthora infestans]|nr:hypothetical protein PInf_010012 [Phytophthora infestans]